MTDNIMIIFNTDNEQPKELMHITPDRKLVFADDVTPKEAAEAFAKSFNEYMAEITKGD